MVTNNNVIAFGNVAKKQLEESKKKVIKGSTVNNEVVDNLRAWLDLAERGEITGMVGVILNNQKTLFPVYTGEVFENYLSFKGMLADLQIELKNNYNGE